MDYIALVISIAIPVLWFAFRLERHIANDGNVEDKLDKIYEELLKGRNK